MTLPMVVPAPDLPARVRIHEVGARDGLQNEKSTVPTEVKAEFIHRLADAGLTTIEATSFVHPKWVPQLADAEALFPLVSDLSDLDVALPVLVPNRRGLDRDVNDQIDERGRNRGQERHLAGMHHRDLPSAVSGRPLAQGSRTGERAC